MIEKTLINSGFCGIDGNEIIKGVEYYFEY